MTPLRAVALLCATLLHGCGGDAPDSAGGDTGLDAPDRTLELTPEPVYEVGGFESPDWAAFGSIVSTAFDGRGHLFVLDGQANTVTEIDPAGAFVRTIGRPGEGPGELSSPFSMTVSDQGEVAIFDLGHRGWVVYGSDGEYSHNVQVDVGEVGWPGGTLSAMADGGVVGPITGRMRINTGDSDDDDSDEAEAPGRPVAWFGLQEGDSAQLFYQAWDLPAAPEGDQQSMSMEGGGSLQLRMPVLRAFEPGLHASATPDGRVAVVDSIGYRVKLVDVDGTVSATLERPIAPTAVTPRIQDQEKERRAAEMAAREGGGMMITVSGSGGGVSGGQVDNDAVRRMMEGRLETMIFAEEIPVIEAMAVDPFGRVWVQRSSGQPGVEGPTDLLTVDGRYLGTITPEGPRIPEAFGPNGLMVREVTDEFDVPTLVVERMPAEIDGR